MASLYFSSNFIINEIPQPILIDIQDHARGLGEYNIRKALGQSTASSVGMTP